MVFASIYRNIHGTHMFPQCFSVSHLGNIVSSVSFCFQDANYAYVTQQGISTKVQACEHSSNFCEHFQIEWDHSIPSMNMLHKSFYHINTNEIQSELSRENMISSHVKRSPLLGLHIKIVPFDALFFI